MEKSKKVSESYAEQVHVLTMETLNGNQRLGGYHILKWTDEVSTVVARRHCNSDVATVGIQNLRILRPAYNKDTVIVKGRIDHVGRTSMAVKIEIFIERFAGEQTLISDAIVWVVALDENEQKIAVPAIEFETDEQRDFDKAEPTESAVRGQRS